MPDRIRTLVEAYFAFAGDHAHLWSAIYKHRAPANLFDAVDHDSRSVLTAIVDREVRAALPLAADLDVPRFVRSLIATVHGHCSYALGGTFTLLEETDPAGSALARVRECLTAHGCCSPSARD